MMSASSMHSLVQDYLNERRRLGFDLDRPGSQLLAFARFVDRVGHTGPLTAEIILAWAQGEAMRATPITWARRLDVVRPFLKHRALIDPETAVPDGDIFGRARRRLTPHIFTEGEIADLLAAARRLPPPATLRPATYEAFFGLIASTGLRHSEALHLRCSDLDLAAGHLTVRQTKFRKSRLVPLHATVLEAMNRYLTIRRRLLPSAPADLVFVSPAGTAIADRTAHGVFEKLRAGLKWTARGDHPAPRIHDLRHSFICRRVMAWHENGANIDNAMLALSTYVGHAKVSDTYWYLTGVPELMAVAGKRFEEFAANAGEKRHG